MAIEKAIYPSGDGIEEQIEVEIINPDAVSISDDESSLFMDFSGEEDVTEHGANLVEFMDESELGRLGSELVGLYDADKESRHDWEESYIKGLDLLGMRFEDRTTPWDGACGVFHPMLAEAVVRFQSQTIMEIFPASGPAKTTILGEITDKKSKQADRVQDYLNYLMTVEMTEYRGETENVVSLYPLQEQPSGKYISTLTWDDPVPCLYRLRTL